MAAYRTVSVAVKIASGSACREQGLLTRPNSEDDPRSRREHHGEELHGDVRPRRVETELPGHDISVAAKAHPEGRQLVLPGSVHQAHEQRERPEPQHETAEQPANVLLARDSDPGQNPAAENGHYENYTLRLPPYGDH